VLEGRARDRSWDISLHVGQMDTLWDKTEIA